QKEPSPSSTVTNHASTTAGHSQEVPSGPTKPPRQTQTTPFSEEPPVGDPRGHTGSLSSSRGVAGLSCHAAVVGLVRRAVNEALRKLVGVACLSDRLT